jgi:hypothetical protein
MPFGAGMTEGILVVTEQHDTAALAGLFVTAGALTITASPDVFAGLAPITHGTLSASGGSDTAALAGWCIIASLGYTENHDTAAASGGFNAPGSLSKTGGSDTPAAAGGFTASGSLSKTAGNDVFAGTATNTFVSSAFLLGGAPDTLAGSAGAGPPGALSGGGRPDSFSGAGSFSTTASLSGTGANDALLGGVSQTEYHIYSNTNANDPTGYVTADPIDYTLPIATTGLLTWTSSPLAYPGTWRFGVRAFDTLTMLEEKNLDCAVTIILNASGVDISTQPKAPTALRALARAGGTIRVEWAYNTINPSPIPTGFHVYIGTGGMPSYGSPAATVLFSAAIAGSFMADLTGLPNGTTYTLGVRAYNSTAEEANTVTVNCTADATGPAAVSALTAIAI